MMATGAGGHAARLSQAGGARGRGGRERPCRSLRDIPFLRSSPLARLKSAAHAHAAAVMRSGRLSHGAAAIAVKRSMAIPVQRRC